MVRITLSGTPGSGKSTTAELLHEELSLPYVYSGLIFRELAKEHNMNLAEFGSYCETHDDIDRELDEKQVSILKKGNVILEGRLAGWLAVLNDITAFKIWIDAKARIRAKRIVEREGGNIQNQYEKLLKRQKSEQIRYKKYYDIDVMDTSIYDLFIDSSKKSPQEILQIILDEMRTEKRESK